MIRAGKQHCSRHGPPVRIGTCKGSAAVTVGKSVRRSPKLWEGSYLRGKAKGFGGVPVLMHWALRGRRPPGSHLPKEGLDPG